MKWAPLDSFVCHVAKAHSRLEQRRKDPKTRAWEFFLACRINNYRPVKETNLYDESLPAPEALYSVGDRWKVLFAEFGILIHDEAQVIMSARDLGGMVKVTADAAGIREFEQAVLTSNHVLQVAPTPVSALPRL
jgi:hypothetical protein